jgi:hypothetical protein
MKNIKLLAIVESPFCSSTINAQVSGCKHRSAVNSYIRSLRARIRTTKETVEYQQERVIVDNRDYDEDRCDMKDMTKEDMKIEIRKTSW